ncbi:MAG: hypothetical protein MH252_07150 [Thermosynechococcaceae cyanobacterium MS004]|nr:hypothetical protein [Thermosynechococcaceae cyanobacterium MS004]
MPTSASMSSAIAQYRKRSPNFGYAMEKAIALRCGDVKASAAISMRASA